MATSISLPTVDDVLQAVYAGEAGEVISYAESAIDNILSLNNFLNLPTYIKTFIEESLPTIFSLIIELEKPSSKIVNNIISFFGTFLNLVIKLNLSEHLLKVISDELEIFQGEVMDFEPIFIEPDQVDKMFQEISTGNKKKYLSSDKSTFQLRNGLIQKLFESKIFLYMHERRDHLTQIQKAYLLRIYSTIETYLNEKVNSLLINEFTEISLKTLQNCESDYDIFITFFTEFIKMLPRTPDSIVELICKLAKNGSI